MSAPGTLLVALAAVPAPGEWATHGRCVKAPTELFFPGRGEDCTAAKRICGGCPVLDECRAYGMAHAGLKGVFGGLTENERRTERKRRSAEIISVDAVPAVASAAEAGVAAPGTLYRQLERLVDHPGEWARVVRYGSKHSAAALASMLRSGAKPVPAGSWEFEGRLNAAGGSDLYARSLGSGTAAAGEKAAS